MARPDCRLVRRRGHAARSVGLHQRPPVRLLVVGDAHHEDLDVDAEQRARIGERRSPLPRPGLGRDPADARFPVVEGLRRPRYSACGCRPGSRLRTCSRSSPECRAPSRAAAPGTGGSDASDDRRRERARESRCTARSRPPAESAPSGKSGARSSGPTGCSVPGCRTGRRRRRQVGDQVVPALGQTAFVENVLEGLAHGFETASLSSAGDLTE